MLHNVHKVMLHKMMLLIKEKKIKVVNKENVLLHCKEINLDKN